MHILHLLHQHRQIDMDYLTLLLNTYINEKDVFSEVIQNRQIQFEKEHSISKKEFYFNCRKVVESINSKIDDRFYKRQNELCQIIDLKGAKGEPTENIEKDLNTINKNQFPINLLHLTADKFRGNFYLTDVNFIETSLNELQYISEAEKTQVRNKLLPHWLFYRVEHEIIDIAYKQMVLDFEDVQKYEVLIKHMIRISEKIFFEQIAPLDRKEFIIVINDQYNNYNLKCSDMTDWLNATYKLITIGRPGTEINIQSKSEFLEWHKEKIKTITPKTHQQINEIDSYISSYNQTDFDQVMIDDKTINSVYLGNNFNEWLENINKNLNSNKSYDAETQDTLGNYNKYLCNLANNIMTLYKEVSKLVNTGNKNFETSIYIRQNKVLEDLELIGLYSEKIKIFIEHKEVIQANDIKNYCLRLLKNCVFNLNDVLTINVYSSPLKTYFNDVETELENSIDFENLKLLKDLSIPVQAHQQTKTYNPDEVKNSHPMHDPNLWNNDCFELFKYLYDCYYKSTKRQLTNIWFYLKENRISKYNFKATKDQYKDFILKNYQIKISNFEKAPTKWEDKEYQTINDHRINFEDALKQIAETAKNT